MLPAIATDIVELLKPTTSGNGYGDDGPGGYPATGVQVAGCSLQPEFGLELLDGRVTVVNRWRWYGPETPQVGAGDRIRFRGTTYKVSGAVERWSGLGLDHQTCLLEAVS